MDVIIIQKIHDTFAVPALAIYVGTERKLIPNPAGQEAIHFDTLETAVLAIQQAGFDYEYNGQRGSVLLSAGQSAARQPVAISAGQQLGIEGLFPVLIARLSDREPSVLVQAAQALGEVGLALLSRSLPEVAAQQLVIQAIPALIQLLGHDDPTVRKAVAEALAKLSPYSLEPLRLAYLSSKTAVYIRLTVMLTLTEMMKRLPVGLLQSVLPLITDGLQDEHWLVRAQAAQAAATMAVYYRAV